MMRLSDVWTSGLTMVSQEGGRLGLIHTRIGRQPVQGVRRTLAATPSSRLGGWRRSIAIGVSLACIAGATSATPRPKHSVTRNLKHMLVRALSRDHRRKDPVWNHAQVTGVDENRPKAEGQSRQNSNESLRVNCGVRPVRGGGGVCLQARQLNIQGSPLQRPG